MKKKIVILGPAHPLRGGGITTFNERLAYQFQEEGHDVTIYSFSLQYPSFLFPGKSQYTDEPAPKGLRILSKVNSINPINWFRVGNELRKLRPDHIVVRFWLPFMGPSLGTILRQVKKNGHTRIVSIVDNIIPHEKRLGDKVFSKYFINSIHHCVVMSKRVGEDLKTFVQDQSIRFVPHPLYDNYGEILPKEQARSFLKLQEGAKYILFFGFIRKYKGLDLLYRAMGDERVKALGVRLLVAGEYYVDANEYSKIAVEEGIVEQLDLHTHFISNERVKHYFSASDLVVQPYKTATQSGISQLAYHFEKPMLVTRVGGLPEIVNHGESGYVVPTDSSSIADAIVDYYEHQREADFIEGVKENKKRFSWSHLSGALLGHDPS